MSKHLPSLRPAQVIEGTAASRFFCAPRQGIPLLFEASPATRAASYPTIPRNGFEAEDTHVDHRRVVEEFLELL